MNERGAEHVRVYRSDACLLADRSEPTVGGAPVETLAVEAGQDRAVMAFTDGEVDGASGARNERNHRWFVAFADGRGTRRRQLDLIDIAYEENLIKPNPIR